MQMNATHEPADQLQPFERPAPRAATTSTARGTLNRHADDCGSYGRGSYAGRSTYGLDFASQGSYARGSYGMHSTYDLDFRPQDSYARGMQQGQLPGDAQPHTERAIARGTINWRVDEH